MKSRGSDELETVYQGQVFVCRVALREPQLQVAAGRSEELFFSFLLVVLFLFECVSFAFAF